MSALAMILHATASAGRRLPSALATLLLALAIGAGSSAFAQESGAPAPSAPALTPQQIDQLVAPIALYPDNLLGQVLTASTYPLEVVMAARWSAANPKVSGPELEAAMQMQPWDPSVKALTAVPQTLQMMNDKLDWTKDLGEAYLAQPDDVATSVQRLRARADASGNLKPSDQVRIKHIPPPSPPPPELVVGAPPPPPEYIVIEPVQPDVLFVPVYDPFLVYGVWPWPAYRPFYWYPPGFVSVGVFGWGPPLVVGAAVWCSYNWYSRRVDIDVVRFNRFNHTNLANTPQNQAWRHDPAHRGNIAYSNPALQQRFGHANASIDRGSPKLFSKQGGGGGAGKGIANIGKTTPDLATGKHFPSNANSGGGNQNKGRENFSRSANINPGPNNENNNNNRNNNKGGNNSNGNTHQNTNRNFNRGAGNNNFNPGRNAQLGGGRGPGPVGVGGGGGGKGGGGGGEHKGKGH